jgi:hypothetical protein
MQIPNCYDPIAQEEQRQADWDRYADKLPVCVLCRKKILPGTKVHTSGTGHICPSCFEELYENIEIVEDPE